MNESALLEKFVAKLDSLRKAKKSKVTSWPLEIKYEALFLLEKFKRIEFCEATGLAASSLYLWRQNFYDDEQFLEFKKSKDADSSSPLLVTKICSSQIQQKNSNKIKNIKYALLEKESFKFHIYDKELALSLAERMMT